MSAFDKRQKDLTVEELQRENNTLVLDNRNLKSKLRGMEADVLKIQKELGILSAVGERVEPPGWLTSPPKSSKKHVATPVFMLSDLHLDEVVRPEEMFNINAYNRAIAEQRLQNVFRTTVQILRDYWSDITYDGIILPLGGDIFGGDIHEELAKTNADTVLGSLDHWHGPFVEGIEMLADEFGKVHIPVVAGNHGRTTRKKQYKNYARSNFDWYFGKSLQRNFRSDRRITFDVSDASDVMIPVYDKTMMMTHGDQTGGGGGIGGIWPPIMRMNAKKTQRQQAIQMPYDMLLMGHWHQLVFGQGFIINGSLKGYDEFAYGLNFLPEPPQQALWLMTPERGMTWRTQVVAGSKETEDWS